jgi:hypothetical protein
MKIEHRGAMADGILDELVGAHDGNAEGVGNLAQPTPFEAMHSEGNLGSLRKRGQGIGQDLELLTVLCRLFRGDGGSGYPVQLDGIDKIQRCIRPSKPVYGSVPDDPIKEGRRFSDAGLVFSGSIDVALRGPSANLEIYECFLDDVFGACAASDYRRGIGNQRRAMAQKHV